MKTNKPQKTFAIGVFLSIFFIFTYSYAQVGIGNTNPNTNSLLEIGDGTDSGGVLLPRVSLTATNNPAPLSTDVAGMIVYNTNTNGSGATAVSPGFYYNDGTDWIRINPTESDDWTTTGNTGTTAGTNYIGTSDATDVVLSTNGAENMRLVNGGQVSVNDTSPIAGDRFTVSAASTEWAINGYAFTNGVGVYGSGAYGVYGFGSLRGVYGAADTSTSFGVVAFNSNTTGTGIVSSGANQPLNYWTSTGATLNGSSTGAIGRAGSSTGTGLSGVGNGETTSRTLTAGSGVAGSGDTGVYGVSVASSNGTGIIGLGDLTSSITTNTSGSGISGSSLSMGVFGYAGNGDDVSANEGNAGGEFILDGDNDPTTNSNNSESNRARAILAGYDNLSATDTGGGNWNARDSYFGGYFSGGNENGGNQTYAYAGLRYRIGNDGTSGGSTTDFKVIGPGNNSTIIKDSENNPRILFSPEAPEIVFQDFGVGQLINGQARINIDPLLKGSLHIDNKHPLKVYVTLEGDCKGVYVTNKSADGFTVKELQGGTSNVSFSWQIVANRADSKDSNGNIVSKHVDVRLPIGPGPIGSELKKLTLEEDESKRIKKDLKTKKDKPKEETKISEK